VGPAREVGQALAAISATRALSDGECGLLAKAIGCNRALLRALERGVETSALPCPNGGAARAAFGAASRY
jgi:hypothetical protein